MSFILADTEGDPLAIDYKIAVQVKLHHGVHDDTHALEQSRQGP